MPSRRSTLLAAALAALVIAPSSAHASVTVGIGEQQPSSFADARLRALGLRTARLIVPYDAVSSRPAQVQAWLDAVAAAGLEPQVAFEHLAGEDCAASARCTLPSTATYRADVAAFHARWPQVTTFTTWIEGNHQSQPTASRPEAVGAYYGALREVCPTCTIVAGDALDSGSYVRWLQRVRAAAPGDPQLWGLHDYAETTYGSPASTDVVLAAVPGQLWLEETGGIVTLRNASGVATLPTDEARAAAAVTRAFAVARTHPRVTRMSVYQWASTSTARFDAGLIRPDGTARPSLDAMARGIASLGGTASAGPSVTTSWSTAHRRQLVVRLRCRATGSTCAGRARVWLLTRRSAKGRVIRTKLGVRRYATTSNAARVTLRLRVPAAAYARARLRASRLELRLAATAPATSSATLRRVVRRAR